MRGHGCWCFGRRWKDSSRLDPGAMSVGHVKGLISKAVLSASCKDLGLTLGIRHRTSLSGRASITWSLARVSCRVDGASG